MSRWADICREHIRAAPSAPPPYPERTAADIALDLIDRGFSLKERGDKLIVHPAGLLEDEDKYHLQRQKELVKAIVRAVPVAHFPIGWEQEWRLETDAMLRRAAGMWHGEHRRQLLRLARKRCESEADWLSLGWELMELEHALRAKDPAGDLPADCTLVPWEGWYRSEATDKLWVRAHGASSLDWDDCWRQLLAVEVPGTFIERVIRPKDKHPDNRRRPR